MPKLTKKSDPFLDPKLAAARLMQLALDRMLFAKAGYGVKWDITIRYEFDKTKATGGALVRPVCGKFSSGEL
jgi:hypothetical protein